MNKITEAALEQSVLEYLDLEDVAVAAFQEAVAWRSAALMAIEQLAVQQQRADILEKRLRQVMGVDPWHTTEEMES